MRRKQTLVLVVTAGLILAGCKSYRGSGSLSTPTPTTTPRPHARRYCLEQDDFDQIISQPTLFSCDRTLPTNNCDPACDGVPPDSPGCNTICEREVVEPGVEWVLAAENVEVAKVYVHKEKQLVLQEYCNYPETNTRYYTWKCHPNSQPQWGSIYAYTLWRLHDPPYNRDLQNGDRFDVYIRKDTPDEARFLCQESDNAAQAAGVVTGIDFSAAGAPGGMTTIIVTLPDEVVEASWDFQGTAQALDLEAAPPRQKLKTIDIPGATPSSYDVYVNLLKAFSPDEDAHLYLVEKDLLSDPNNPPETLTYQRYSILTVTRPEGGEQGLQLGTFNPFPPTNPWFNYYLPESKPAIYLYPQNKQSISLKLQPQGQLTTSLPTYPVGGWQLTADPDGTISYQGKRYPYLYYESEVTGYPKPEQGSIVALPELEPFLRETLPQLGLKGREIEDFLNYWLARLKPVTSPYLLISFLDPLVINQVDPLIATPAPETLIRVRTYFKPLDRPLPLPPQKLPPAPPRNGFTIVEWGGIFDHD